jgi:two-component system CheB/CheR fusion protein
VGKNDKPAGRRSSSAGKQTPKVPTRKPTPPASAAVASEAHTNEEHELPAGPRSDFPIVGIGASAGGLAAFEEFFSALPQEDTGMAFVLVPHLAPDHKSILHEIVGRYTRMQVHEVEDGATVKANCTYIIPPNRDMALLDGTLKLTSPTSVRGGIRLPIDFFFRSLAEQQRDRAVCVVLSGTGSDGTLGVRAIKGEGGMAMAQTPATTEHDGMPRSAIATGMIDYVLPPRDMPVQLMAYARHAFGRDGHKPPPPKADDTLKKLCVLLRAQTGHDFSQYKESTLLRRIERRMALYQMDDPEQYVAYVRANIPEAEGLFRDLLIGVTNFFRDAEAYKALEEKVIRNLLDSKASEDVIRVWVCGCSTGEEAYSIAILLQEQMDVLKRAVRVQVFATDIDREAVEHARTGVYPASIAADVSAERLSRYFVFDQEAGTYRVQKVIRDLLVFSEQDVIRDPPFSKLDLISCRNLLIYLKTDLQKRLIHLFHYAMRPGGVLFLGNSETVGDLARQFSIVDRKYKIYMRQQDELAGPRPALGEFVVGLLSGGERRPRGAAAEAVDRRHNLRAVAEQALLAHYAHAGLLIDERGDVLHIVGRTGKFLEPASGDAAMNVVAMAREGLQRPLSTALHRTTTHKQTVTQRNLRVRSNGGYTNVNLTVRPLPSHDGEAREMYLVVIEESAEPASSPDTESSAAGGEGGRIVALEQELRAKEEYLQTTLEEMETTNEELKSTNEEMQSVNEELQSTNEELETSKEELQSVNEELSTVNAELQDKVSDLSRANNDMNNLLAGTGVGTLFVDHQMRISRFTPSATQIINLIQHDVGRPVEHLVTNLVDYPTLVEDVRAVLDTLQPKEAEVQIKTGAWYLMRIRPYRTIENVIEGVVVTFFDISDRKRADMLLRASEARFQAIFQQAFAGMAQMDLMGRFLFANDQLCRMTDYSQEDLRQLTFRELTLPDDRSRYDALLSKLLTDGSDFTTELRLRRKSGKRVTVNIRVNAINGADSHVESVVAIAVVIRDEHGQASQS